MKLGTWQDCSSTKYASIDGVDFWCDVTFKMATMTSISRRKVLPSGECAHSVCHAARPLVSAPYYIFTSTLRTHIFYYTTTPIHWLKSWNSLLTGTVKFRYVTLRLLCSKSGRSVRLVLLTTWRKAAVCDKIDLMWKLGLNRINQLI